MEKLIRQLQPDASFDADHIQGQVQSVFAGLRGSRPMAHRCTHSQHAEFEMEKLSKPLSVSKWTCQSQLLHFQNFPEFSRWYQMSLTQAHLLPLLAQIAVLDPTDLTVSAQLEPDFNMRKTNQLTCEYMGV